MEIDRDSADRGRETEIQPGRHPADRGRETADRGRETDS